MKIATFALISGLTATFFLPLMANAHCEMPCGIYDDGMRYDMLDEDIATIEKSMDMIIELSAEGEKNYNQLVRWIVTKEEHAQKFMDIISQYFLNQRIKPAAPEEGQKYTDYINQLTTMHQMLIYAMKCKQTTDKANTVKLKELLAESRTLYFKEHGHEH
jgi:nickel superoxide dismutase